MARAARGARLVGSDVDTAGRHAGAVPRRQRLSRQPASRRPRRADDDRRSRSPRGARHDARRLPPQQWPYRGWRASARGLLQLRRESGGRHGQPRERAGSQRLRRAGDDACAGADDFGERAARQRDAAGRAGPGIRRRLRHHRAGEVRPAGRRQRPGRHR